MEQQNSATNRLDKLAILYGTDKSSLIHNYTEQYALYLDPIRSKEVSVLELGWGGHEDPDAGGASAQMWRDYFPNGDVVCVDLEKKNLTGAHSGIHFRQGSQADPEFIRGVVEEFGPFDLIVDDASHLSSLTIKSWELLYPHLKSGGFYVLEDSHSSYHSHWYGEEEANLDPDKNGTQTRTAMNYFKRMADEVNFKGRWDSDLDLFPREHWMGYELEWVHFYFNLLVVKRR